MTLLRSNGRSIGQFSDDLRICFGCHQFGRTNKHGGKRPFIPISEHRHVQVCLKRIDLPPKGVARHLDIHQAQQRLVFPLGAAGHLFRQEDHSRTGAPDRFGRSKIMQWFH